MTDENPPLIIDNGSSLMKAGFSGDEAPLAVFPTVTSQQKVAPILLSMGSITTYVGDNALCRRGINVYKYPIDRGLITDWYHMEKIWHHTFYNELRVAPEEHEVLLMGMPLNSKETKAKMAQIMFESFKVQGLCLANQCAMSIFASGRMTGVVLGSGDGVTNSVPIYEGYALSHATNRLELGGKDLTDYLKKMLMERGYNFNTMGETAIVMDMKEKTGYVASNFVEETAKESLYELPDGNVISLGRERFKTTEILFQPNLIGMEVAGIHENIFTSIRKSDLDIRKELYSNIVLSGGSTLFNGIVERLNNELREISPSTMKIRITAPPERKYSTWIGGSIFSQLPTFQSTCITAQEYADVGSAIVHRKCF
ncbi:hypothetical protein NAEGRDRAFT_29917 [Naegleria gruberi]|uniref:Actin n=1 Tax=Naegleria gruberi TaxID=5762 RepID=D2V0N9_NAEGR|nr:uncharacterized protein NAEGRDRAFT_29917 [Naegleria gruberi]EFC49554.1 hypothetical protein NAEGRDRAFT_29917 [Naegleria gruberi]|eukprot:XP_002682298.1 hypothetical protein NAEGRDRAFT_29917 [Naegleria gruberi strain NEG-M]